MEKYENSFINTSAKEKKDLTNIRASIESLETEAAEKGDIFEIPKDMKEDMQKLSNIENRDLTLQESEQFLNTMKAIKHQIVEDKKAFRLDKKKTMRQLAEQAYAEFEPKKHRQTDYMREVSTAATEFHRLGGNKADNSSVMDRVYNNAENGAIAQMSHEEKAAAHFQSWIEKFAKGKNSNFLEKFTTEIVDKNSGLTKATRVSLALAWEDRANNKSIETHYGFRVPVQEKLDKGRPQEARAEAETVVMSPKEVKAQIRGMTEAEKNLAELYKTYRDYIATPELNRVSREVLGYDAFTVENHFSKDTVESLTSGKETTVDVFSQSFADPQNMGFTQKRVNDSTIVYISPIFDVINKTVAQNAKYIGYAAPMHDLRSFLRTKMSNGTNMLDVLEKNGELHTVEYIKKWTNDLLGQKKDRNLFDTLRSAGAKAALGMNIRTILQQPTSYFKAGAIVDFDSLIKGMGIVTGEDRALMRKYAPLLWKKKQGMGSIEISDAQSRVLGKKGIEWGKGLQVADNITSEHLWLTAVAQTEKDNPKLKQGTGEFYEKSAVLANRLMLYTQQTGFDVAKSGLNRNKAFSSLTMFTGEPIKDLNMLMRSSGDMISALKSGDKEQIKIARKNLRKTVGSQLTSLVVNTAVKALVDVFVFGREDKFEDEEKQINIISVLSGVGTSALKDFAGLFPIIGNIAYGLGEQGFKIAKGESVGSIYDVVSSFELENINKFYTGFVKFLEKTIKSGISAWNGESLDRVIKQGIPALRDGLEAGSRLLGVPEYNIERYIRGIAERFPYVKVMLEDVLDAPKMRSDLPGAKSEAEKRQIIKATLNNALPTLEIDKNIRSKLRMISEFAKLYNATEDTEVLPTGNKKSVEGYDLTLAEQIKYRTDYGDTLSKHLNELIGTKQYENADIPLRTGMLKDLYSYAEHMATADYREPELDENGKVKPTIYDKISEVKTVSVSEAVSYKRIFSEIAKTSSNDAEDKRRALFADKSLTWKQMEELDTVLINTKNGAANYRTKGDFEMSFLTDAQAKSYSEFGLTDYVGKSNYAKAVNDLAAAKIAGVKETVTKYENGKRVTEEKTVTNSAGLLKREYIETNMKYLVEGLTQKQKSALYEALGIGKAVASMTAWEFTREVNNIKKIMNKKAG
jgi:hypothetical protein